MSQQDRNQVIAEVVRRAREDADFRTLLQQDPRGALATVTGMPIPEFVSIEVHEDSLTHVHLVIPYSLDAEIADADLEVVAGGYCWADAPAIPYFPGAG